MKPFRYRPRKDQIKFWITALNRSHSASKARLQSIYANSLGRAAQLEDSAKRLESSISARMDRVADAADRHYQGWDVWRHDPKLLRKVVDQMDAATATLRERQARLLVQARTLRARYLEELEALDETQERLLKEANAV